MSKKFLLQYTIDCTVSLDELWPENDGPENPTVEDVEDLINSCGGWERVILDWNLAEGAEAYVTSVDDPSDGK